MRSHSLFQFLNHPLLYDSAMNSTEVCDGDQAGGRAETDNTRGSWRRGGDRMEKQPNSRGKRGEKNGERAKKEKGEDRGRAGVTHGFRPVRCTGEGCQRRRCSCRCTTPAAPSLEGCPCKLGRKYTTCGEGEKHLFHFFASLVSMGPHDCMKNSLFRTCLAYNPKPCSQATLCFNIHNKKNATHQ